MMIARLAVLGVATWLLPRPLLATNEEATRRVKHETREESEAVANTTLESSLKVVASIPGMNAKVLSFIQESLGARHSSGLKRHSKQHLRRATQQSQRKAVGEAVVKISSQFAEASAAWEVEDHRCCKMHKSLESQLEDLGAEIAQANSQSSTAQGEMMRANKKIAMLEDSLPTEKDTMRELKEQCDSDRQSVQSAMSRNSEDLDRLDELPLTDCDGSTLLLQCSHDELGESFLMLNHSAKPSREVWQAPVVQRLLQDVSAGTSSGIGPAFFLQLSDRQDPHSCRMQANPECQQIRDRYLLMTSDYEDESNELQEKLYNNDNACESKQKQASDTIEDGMAQLKQAQTGLAEATGDYSEAMEASRLKNAERESFVSNMNHEMRKCLEAKDELVARKNSLMKIRGELLTINQMQAFVQDCQVSDWTPSECSQSCGKGYLTKTRQVMIHPGGNGAACPPLTVTEDCNEQHCPVDCTMGEWSGWSTCSAKCAGGVTMRMRDIDRHSVHGGKPCGATQEVQSCNPQDCDEPCELSAWSPWSACSKKCDGGTSFKVKTVVKQGMKCPKKHSKHRFHSRPCNPQPCLQTKDVGKTLKCNSKLDVVLLMDGSASLRASGWAAMQAASKKIAQAMGEEVNLAAILYSGPKTRKNYFKCTGQKWPNRKTGSSLGTANMETDCLVKWVSHLSPPDQVANEIGSMQWPRGSSLLSEALAMADSELSNGRKDAQAVVLAITDGKPMNKRKVQQMVGQLRTKARLMFMSVTQNAPIFLLKKWASWPVEENLIQVSSVNDLTSEANLNKVVANMCQSLELD